MTTNAASTRRNADRLALTAAVGAVVGVAASSALLRLTPEQWVDHPGDKASSPTWILSTALAITAVVFLSATLSIGPVRVLRGAPPAIHLPWRRTLGVTAALLGVAHLTVALNIHGTMWRPWQQFITGRPTADDPFVLLLGARGVANLAGLSAAAALVTLGLLSRNRWMRRLGSTRWKSAQRFSYLVLVLVSLHAFLYWIVEERLLIHRAVVLVPVVVTVSLQGAAAVSLRRTTPRS